MWTNCLTTGLVLDQIPEGTRFLLFTAEHTGHLQITFGVHLTSMPGDALFPVTSQAPRS